MKETTEVIQDVSGKVLLNKMCETQPMYCSSCGRFLGNQAIMLGAVEFLCPKCKKWTIIEVLPE
ncbi:MAG: hypothetical protein PHI12_08495 [Dehalococcoidales bacterium]|nr:hypothetical protein [Dehalococcoidales bacterium]